MKTNSTVAISYHSIDASFAQYLAMQLEHLEFATILLEADNTHTCKPLTGLLCQLALIRSEYVQLRYCVDQIKHLENRKIPTIAILRSPVSIKDWPIQLAFQDIMDFSEYSADNPLLLQSLLSRVLDVASAKQHPISSESIGVNTLNINPHSDKTQIFPLDIRLELELPHIHTSYSNVIHDFDGRNICFSSLEELAETVDSFVLLSRAGSEYGSIFKRDVWSQSLGSTKVNPRPFYIDAANWRTNSSIQENLKAHCDSSDNLFEALQTGEAALFLDSVSELGEESHNLLQQLRNWLVSTSRPQKIIITGYDHSSLDYTQLQLPIVHVCEPLLVDLRKYQYSLCNTVTNYTSVLTEVDLSDAHYLYQHRSILELCFKPWTIQFSGQTRLTVRDLISAGIAHFENSHEVNSELNNRLTSLAVYITEQSPPGNSISYDLTLSLLGNREYVDEALSAQTIIQIGNRIRFASSTHQAYFAAKELKQGGIKLCLVKPEFNQRQMRQKRNWDEAILIVTLLAPNASELLLTIADIDPFFALDCVVNGARLSLATYNKLIDQAVESMARLGDRRIYLATRLAFFDASAATKILLEVMRNGIWDDRMLASHFLEYIVTSPLPGLRDFLYAETDGYDHNVLEAIRVLNSSALPTIFLAMKHDNSLVRKKAARVLGELKDAAAIPRLIELLSDIDHTVIAESTKSISSIESAMLTNPRETALPIHGEAFWIESESADTVIHSNLTDGLNGMTVEPSKDSVMGIRRTANRFSRESTRIVDSVRKTMTKILPIATVYGNENTSSSRIVKQRLITAIGQQSLRRETLDHHQEIVADLENQDIETTELILQLKRLQNGNWSEREDAAKAIRSYAKSITIKPSREVMMGLIELVRDEDWLVRWTCIEALAWLQSSESVPALIESIHDINWKVRVAVIHSLVKIGDHSAAIAIIESISDENPLVREAAVEALGSMGLQAAIASLSIAIQDPEEFVRLAAVEALAKINTALVVDPLFSALEDPSVHVRWAAVNALSGLATPKDLWRLRKLLDDTNGPYWEQKRICDVVADILDQLDRNTSVVVSG